MSTEENRQNLEGELNFTRGINDLKKKLHNLSAESPRKSGMDSASKARSLQAIQIIANQGVNSTALTNQVERFLSAHTLPSHSKVSAGSVLQCIENSTAMITIDLALTTANTFQDFKDLLNIASKYCPELNTRVQSPISAQATSTKPLGYIVYTQNLMMLLQEINRNRPSDTDAEISLHQFLRSHQYPFSLKSLKDNINFWKLLNLAFLDFDKNVEESRFLVGSKEGLLVKCQKNIKETQNIFESVIKLTESSSEFMDLGKPDVPAGEISKNVNYCDLLSRYLSDLSTFVLENVSTKGGVLSEPITLHTLLEQSAVDIVDKLIFDHHIEPGVLEKKAQQLGFNLLASLIAGCCPKLPQMMSANENSACPLADRIVLNELFPDYKSLSPSDPIKVVTNILSELLIAFQTYSENKQCDEMEEECGKDLLTLNDISELRSDMKIQRILEKTLDLNFVEVKTLNEFESLTFFTCLLNLMMCHCYLCSKLDTTDSIYSNHLFFRDIGFYFLGYNVGELGFVSILDVRQLVLGDVFVYGLTSKFLENPNCLRFSPDPRLLFATINNFTISSPPLFLLNFENYETELEEAIAKYVQASVTVEEEKVFVNDLVVNYLDKILVPQCIDSKDSDQNRNNVLLKFLLDYSSDELNDELARLTRNSDISVKVRPKCREIMFRLSYDVTYSNSAKQVEEEFVEKWLSRSLTEPILRHFSQNSRILADIVQKIHEAKEPVPTEVARDVLTEEKLKYLDHLFGAPWLQHLSALFHGNTVIAALSKYPKDENLVKFFEECVTSSNWSHCVDVLFALPDYLVFSNLTVKRFKDIALREATIAASKKDQHKSWYFSEHISDVNIRTATVMSCCKHWPGSVACAQLTSIVYDNPLLPVETREMLMCLIKKIKVYTAIQEFVSDLDARTWHDVCTIANDKPKVIIKCLLKNKKLELCLKWIGLPGVLTSIQPFIDSDFVLPFFENPSQEVELVNQLLDSLPGEKLRQIYNDVMFQLTSVSSISYLVQRALRVDQSPRYRLVEISLKFLFQLDPEDQSLLVHLISSPLLIIEQLIMNMKLDALEKVLKIGRKITDEELLDQNEINKLIVSYAAKSVEFDFIKADKNYDMKSSFISTTSHGSPDFMVPLEVPDKSQWVPDNMVAGYHGVVVRVCQNCYLYQMKADDDMVRCIK
ncbi:hypothetical protein RUM44_001282 [Polyplax serrata]|uniref:Uncharacterized protein n=1 Tax=Polyplax serrata TaxID=468196 RepID=A0ABR1AJJ9_POLSC